MTVVSNDPSWWPTIHANIFYSYFVVASCAAVIYDWGLTFAQEVELIWRQRWSLMTVVYLVARYVAIGFSVIKIFQIVPTISITDALSLIMDEALACMGDVVDIMLGVIMIARLHAMYQRSRNVLIFLVVIFLAIRIAVAVMVAIQLMHTSGEELVLSGNYLCIINIAGDSLFMGPTTWILGIVWEVLALCLAVWIAVKHFRELRQHSSGGIIGDCFMMLIQTHVNYFAGFVIIACLYVAQLSPTLSATFRFMMVSLKSCTWYSCLCWDHALSSVFENIMQNLWPTLIQQRL
ncbi:uncharacterized protein F5891DRAFT_741680 [Suillus fuscotomentosus]|uniref:DUF6533 domain-containing protein n=1 Tax=Suillus fuscotomentosus TaxID=1912939 RepID=A0AAD4HDQ6_9AGAM|nr:uncharacterized protein F5891DRAFT_741680 [Suillus fuscotomentosus]KAG1893835.1 hypothetical protein F5891DRAFT_741680 [Suillus fuscotomentosus]